MEIRETPYNKGYSLPFQFYAKIIDNERITKMKKVIYKVMNIKALSPCILKASYHIIILIKELESIQSIFV